MRSQSETILVPAVTAENISVPLLSGLARIRRDGGLVDISYSLDNRAVRRERSFCSTRTISPIRSCVAGTFLHDRLPTYALRQDLSGLAKSRGLCFTAAFRQRFGEIREPDGQRQNNCYDAVIQMRCACRPEQVRLNRQGQRDQRADHTTNITGLRICTRDQILRAIP